MSKADASLRSRSACARFPFARAIRPKSRCESPAPTTNCIVLLASSASLNDRRRLVERAACEIGLAEHRTEPGAKLNRAHSVGQGHRLLKCSDGACDIASCETRAPETGQNEGRLEVVRRYIERPLAERDRFITLATHGERESSQHSGIGLRAADTGGVAEFVEPRGGRERRIRSRRQRCSNS